MCKATSRGRKKFTEMRRSRLSTEQLAWLRHCAAAETNFFRAIVQVYQSVARVSRKVDERAFARIARFGSVETRSRSIRSGVALRIDEGKSVTPIESSYHVRSSVWRVTNGTLQRDSRETPMALIIFFLWYINILILYN